MTLEQVHSEYKCYNCQKPCIRGDPSLIRAVGNLYHKQCFKCNFCKVSVIDKFYTMDSIQENNVILCEKDYFEYSAIRLKCHQCHGLITHQNDYKTIGNYKYHYSCLHCPGCTIMTFHNEQQQEEERDSTDDERYDYNNRPYCRYHYSLIKGTECIGCGQAVLSTKNMVNNGGKWHQECYMIMKYWHVVLIDLQPILQSDYKSKHQLIIIQNELEYIRCHIWKQLSEFEDTTSKLISNIVTLNQQSIEHSKEFDACLSLWKQVNVLFSVLDLLFKYLTHLSCDISVQRLGDQFVYFLDILCQTSSVQDVERLTKMSTSLSQSIREMIKLSLQQTIILEQRNIGGGNLIDQILTLFQTKSFKSTMDITCIDHHAQLIDMAITRLSFILNIKPEQGKRPHEIYKSQSLLNRPSLFPQHQQRMIHSTSNIPNLSSTPLNTITPTRSLSTTRNMIDTPQTKPPQTISRMDTIRRALTTSRSKKELTRSTTGIFQSNRREKKSFSLQNPPLFISLPDVEQLHTTPPLSPPSANQHIWTIPPYLPDLTLQQDAIIRHIALLYIDSHVIEEESILLEDLISLLETTKKNSTSSSLWGKLKTHILTPTTENGPSNPLLNNNITTSTTNNNEKKIGVSLSNTSHGSLNMYKLRDSTQINHWKTHCPSVVSCFSCHSLAPNFLKDCILSMIDQDVNTEGIFRKNGNIRGLKEMCDQLDESQQQDWTDFFKDIHITQLAAFVKRYLRELPEPLLTYRLHKLFLLSNKVKQDNITLIHYTISLLPKINRDILFLLLSLLHWVAKHSAENKMDYENLARVIAPNILYNHKKQPASSAAADVSLCHGEIRVVATMIEHYETLIKIPGDFTVLLEHPKMAEYLLTNSVDLSCSKQFTKIYHSINKVKKEVASSLLPPSPSTSSS